MTLTKTDLEAIKKILESQKVSCCSQSCKEKCGITPVEHADDHSFLRDFRKAAGTIKVRIINIVTGVIVIGLLSFFAIKIK